MFQKVSIFDFDHTVSIRHTFASHALDLYAKTDAPFLYQVGKKHALANTKIGIREYLKHDIKELSAIATFHNNPHFIAGYIAHLLGKELIFLKNKTIYSSSEPLIAINFYQIKGVEAPFLISYIPKVGQAFQETMNELTGKNNQIEFLRRTLLQESWINKKTIIQYYDDSLKNFTAAASLSLINSYLVDDSNPNFMIKTMRLCDPTAEIDDENDLENKPSELISNQLLIERIDWQTEANITGAALLLLGLLLISIGTFGMGGLVASISLLTVGTAASLTGAGFLGYRFFARQPSNDALSQVKPERTHMLNRTRFIDVFAFRKAKFFQQLFKFSDAFWGRPKV